MKSRPMPLGPVLAAVTGIELSAADRERLVHPLVGGITISFLMELLVYPVIFLLVKSRRLPQGSAAR